MCDVDVSHNPVVVAESGHTLILHGTSANRAVLTNGISVADLQARIFALIFLVLRIVADRCELINMIVLADSGRAVYHDMAFHFRSGTDFNLITDNRIRSDIDVIGDHGSVGDYRGRVDHARISFGAPITSFFHRGRT